MSWEKLEPIKATVVGCATCGELIEQASMNMTIAVGFGYAALLKDGIEIYTERQDIHNEDPDWTFQDAENEALKDPDHDWRVVLDGPLRGRTFQRHDVGKWVLISENDGFA